MVSINDVAKKAGVAKSTVSLVINDKGNVSHTTKERIIKAMKELNYIPSQLASNLSKQRSNIVGIILPNIMHPFFSSFIHYAEQELSESGYMTMVTGTVGREEVEKKYLELLEKRAMDGIIMGVHSLNIEEYRSIDRPIVSLDRYINSKIPVVTSNHEQAASLVADFLKNQKVKKVVQFIGTKKIPLTANDFSEFLKDKLYKEKIAIDSLEIGFNSFNQSDYDLAAERLFNEIQHFDVVIGVDMVIASVLKIAKNKGIRVPEELQLIAYDGTFVTRVGENDFTSIMQPVQNLATYSVTRMLELIDGDCPTEQLVKLDVVLYEGNTTRKR